MNSMSKKIINRFAASNAKYLRISVHDENVLEIKKKASFSKEDCAEILKEELIAPRIEELKSVHVGRYSNGATPLKVGSILRGQTILGTVDSMGIEHAIKAPFDCTIEEIFIEDGSIVQYSQSLFLLKEQI